MHNIYYPILVLGLVLEIIFKPRIDFGEKIILWYGKKTRKFIILF